MNVHYKYKSFVTICLMLIGVALHAQYSEDDLLKEAELYFEQEKYAEAMPLYSQLLSLNPTKPEFNYKYGATALYGDASKKEEAIKYLRYASTKTGISPDCWYFLGRAYHLNYQFADAINAYKKYQELGDKKVVASRKVDREIESCLNGKNLLSNIKDVVVLDKKQTQSNAFFRIYDLSDIGGKILVTPEELLSPLDIKMNHKSLIHFRGAGTSVYFSSYGKDGKNGLDIYRADVLPGGTFSSPERLGGLVNSPYDEDYPFMHPDNQTFYFSSKGHSSMGGYDIFKSVYNSNLDVFSQPENLDFAVNTPDDELLYITDSAKFVANFASARSSKQGELHVYKVEVNSAPVDLTLVKGTFDNQVDSKDNLAQITVIDAATNRQIDVQYTDPVTGAYLLSFPKSGKYKFLVEASNSDRIHAGIVEIPYSTGINAYLQEMDLVMAATAEKLLINNLFDQFYDGDIAELAQKLLKQRASLDVNFNAEEIVVPDVVVVEEQDLAKAASAAGFDAGMTNESIIANSEARQNDLAERKNDISQIKAGAIERYNENVALSSELAANVESLISQANATTGDERSQLMFEAGIEKMRALESIKIAESAKLLSEDLEKLEVDVEKTYQAAVDQTLFLKAGIASEDFETAVNALKAEKAWSKNNATEITNYDVLNLTQAVSITARNDAQKALDRASAYRADADEVQSKLVTRRRQADLAKGKKASELEAEVVVLEQESSDLNEATEAAYKKAEMFEKTALVKRQQYDIVVGLTESFLDDERVIVEEIRIEPITEATYQDASNKLQNAIIENAAVASYFENHPEAVAQFGSDQEAMAFKREYLGTGSSASLDNIEDGMAVTQSDNLNDLTAENTSNTKSEGTSDGSDGLESEASPGKTEDSQSAKQSEKGNLSSGTATTAVPIVVPVVVPNSKSENENAADIKSGDVVAQDETASPQNAKTAETTPEIAVAASEVVVETVVTPEDVDAYLDPYEGKSTDEKIESEMAEVKAANDWIEIIDTSIAEIKAESKGKLNPEDQEQIRKYEELKSAKRGEVLAREERIVDWQEQETNSLANASSTMAEAKADVESLDPSYVARLESKIPSTYADRRYLGKIQNLNSSYLSEMTLIELSGKSNAEIAQDRIAENEAFVLDVSSELESFEISQDERDMLLEIRRLKMLEIAQDQEVLAGQMDFVARTNEGRQNLNIVEAKQAEVDLYNAEALSSLSPKMKADLQEPYSRDLILADYESQKAQIEESSSDLDMREKRLALNNSYMTNLQAEIQVYSQAMQSLESVNGIEALMNRYKSLLSERSAVIDEINSDKTKIAFAEAAAIADQNNIAQEDIEPEIVTEVVTEIEPEIAESEPEHDYVTTFDSLYNAELKAIEAKGLSGEMELRAMANANSKVVGGIDIAIGSLAQELDETQNEKKRDELQIEIQRLDAISADKRQEADRLNAEADQIKLATEVADNQETKTNENVVETTGSTSTQSAEPVDIAELKKGISTTQVNINDINYKSLNANIALNSVKPMVEEVNAKKLEAQVLFEEYESTDDLVEQEEIKGKLVVLQSEIEAADEQIVKEFAKSNAPEIAFYTSGNAEMLSRIESSSLDLISNEEKKKLAKSTFDIEKDLGELNASYESGEITEVERIEGETLLLGRMSVLNETLNENVKLLAGEDVVAIDSTSNPNAVESNEEPSVQIVEETYYSEIVPASVQTIISKPENFVVKSGSEYITPVSETIYSEMTAAEITQHLANDQLLNVDLDFAETENVAEEKILLEQATAVDARGLELMANSPNQLNYLLAAVRADSLKTTEQSQGRYATEMTLMANEELKEVQRLRKAALSEPNERNKKDVLARADKIEVAAINHFERGAIAANKAEYMREMRKREETKLSKMASLLTLDQKAELDAILNNETYRIIPVDLTASGETPVAAKPKEAASPKETTKITAAKPETTKPVKGSGTWLAMVEVIAEKEDFSDVKENMFVQVDAPVYSNRRPIPIDPEMPSGLVFQVQVGAFRKPIPQDLFAQFAPVMGQKLDNGITRYRAGIFREHKDAVVARNSIRQMGYADAFIVVYYDGEKLSAAQVQDILAQVSEVDAIAEAAQSLNNEVAGTTTPSNSNNSNQQDAAAAAYYNNPEAAEAAQVEVTPGLFFTVQVGVYSKPVKLEALYNLTDLNSELTASGVIRYTTGRYASVQAASQGKAIAREKGVTDAFVTAYYNGKKISLSEAEQILSDEGAGAISPIVTGSSSNSTPAVEKAVEEIEYIVIIGSFDGDIPQDLANLFLERSDLNIRRVEGPNGASMYVSEAFDSLADAQSFLDDCHEAGIVTALLGQMKDGEIVSITNR